MMTEHTTRRFTMKDLPQEDRPYEKCQLYGPSALSDAELLAILLNTGVPGMKAIDLAYRLLNLDERYAGLEGLLRLSMQDFRKIPGIGPVKAVRLKAICELGSRISRITYKRGRSLKNTRDAAEYFMTGMRGLEHEELHLMMLDSGLRLLAEECVTVGTVNASLIDPRGIFERALEHGASFIILAHNHPGGSLQPSSQDIQATERVRESGEILGIELKDHLIIGNMTYMSMREEGYLQ